MKKYQEAVQTKLNSFVQDSRNALAKHYEDIKKEAEESITGAGTIFDPIVNRIMENISNNCYKGFLNDVGVAKKNSGYSTAWCAAVNDPKSITDTSTTHAAIAALQKASDELPQVIITALTAFNAITEPIMIVDEIERVSAETKAAIEALIVLVDNIIKSDNSAYRKQFDSYKKCINNTANCNQSRFKNIDSQLKVCTNSKFKIIDDTDVKGCFDYEKDLTKRF